MLLKIWVNGVLHIIPDVISIELYDETSDSEGWISILYITSLEYTKNKPEGIERTTRFNYDEVEHMTVKKVKIMDNKKCKCLLCGKTGELYDDFGGYNYIPVEIPISKQNYLICRDCFEYLRNKEEGRK